VSTLTVQISATTDDARNINGNGTFNSNNTTYRLGNDAGTDVWIGWRWLNITVPQGATINSATLDLFSAQTGVGTTALAIFYGEKVANPVTFSNTTANKPEGRARTTASVAKSFNVANFNSASSFGLDLVDVTTLVQEIVNQATFASGNALVLVGHDNGSSASNNIGITNWEATGNLKGAKLNIDYTAGGGPVNITYITYRPPFMS
jgi:MSHA biogenesis protein MshQ